jgi:hypothetical protein
MKLQNSGTSFVLSRIEAASRGLSRFYTGEFCQDGHQAERFVSNRHCVACNAVKARQRERLRGLNDPSFRMYRNTLRRTGMALRGFASPARSIGCNHPTLRDHIAALFRTGMSWDRYRQWEVDHIEPLANARDTQDLVLLCHYTNLQPLWRRENQLKGRGGRPTTKDHRGPLHPDQDDHFLQVHTYVLSRFFISDLNPTSP